MELNFINILLSLSAGFLSVFSPCILPLIPGIISGTEKDSNKRPILIILGISITFIVLGIISSAFTNLLLGKIKYLEIIGSIIIITIGSLLILKINLFKKLSIFNKIKIQKKTPSFLLGMALGVIWIPCIGPLLSGILTLVATQGEIWEGILLLIFYSIGFSIPLLAIAYLSQIIRKKIIKSLQNSYLVNLLSGSLLIGFGIYLLLTRI